MYFSLGNWVSIIPIKISDEQNNYNYGRQKYVAENLSIFFSMCCFITLASLYSDLQIPDAFCIRME